MLAGPWSPTLLGGTPCWVAPAAGAAHPSAAPLDLAEGRLCLLYAHGQSARAGPPPRPPLSPDRAPVPGSGPRATSYGPCLAAGDRLGLQRALASLARCSRPLCGRGLPSAAPRRPRPVSPDSRGSDAAGPKFCSGSGAPHGGFGERSAPIGAAHPLGWPASLGASVASRAMRPRTTRGPLARPGATSVCCKPTASRPRSPLRTLPRARGARGFRAPPLTPPGSSGCAPRAWPLGPPCLSCVGSCPGWPRSAARCPAARGALHPLATARLARRPPRTADACASPRCRSCRFSHCLVAAPRHPPPPASLPRRRRRRTGLPYGVEPPPPSG